MNDEKRRRDEKRWDRGLKALFGGDHVESVLESIERFTGASSRILLHDLPNEESPLLRVPSLAPTDDRAEDDRRYHVVGEIARGGVGIVHKARDKDLGRDVALKLLRKEQADKPEVLERFIEEAQIGAQLQHPGIVPVYGLGLQPDGRPFFTMKLIKGRTLSALLKEREDPSDDRRRFLAIFEQACQTMAYAHARGVIHRDLKPSNVMVGSFGEVQVVDWGFGKVLGREDRTAERLAERTVVATVRSEQEGSHSIAGSVMGTPAYMPPEQALGHVEQLDERSDVFALGAILCEILTGSPPYAGRRADLLVKAAQARLDEAYDRLDRCGASVELVELVKRCLMPVGEDRPEHASELAKAIESHLAAAEERAHEAKLHAIDQRARLERQREEAGWERRRKRRTRLVAVALLAAVACGGGAYFLADAKRAARAEAARPAVEDAMDEVTRLKSRGRFGEALAMARKAFDLAEAGEVDDALRGRATSLVRDAERALTRHEAADRKRRDDAAFLAELEGVRLAFGDGLDLRSFDRRLASAFRARGLDFDALPAPKIAARIRTEFPAIAVDLAAVLDHWAWRRRTKARLRGLDWEPLVAVPRDIDPDEWRDRLRDALAADDSDALHKLADEALESGLPIRTLHMIRRALSDGGDRETAASFLLEVVRSHPSDFWVNLSLAYDLWLAKPPRYDDAVRFATAALALRPESVEAHIGLGVALAEAKRLDEAIRRLQRAVEMAPDYARAHQALGVALGKSGRDDEALARYRMAARLDPEDVEVQVNLGTKLVNMGSGEEGLVFIREAVRLDSKSARAVASLAYALLELKRLDEAIHACREALELDERHAHAHYVLGWALDKKGEDEEALRMLREALRLGWDAGWVNASMSGPLLDLGRTADAIEVLRRAAKSKEDPALHAFVQGRLGLALLRLNRDAEAIVALREAIAVSPAEAANRFNLGVILHRQGKLEEAADAFREAIQHRPDYATARNSLGGVLWELGKQDEAIAAYKEVTRHGPRVAAMAHYNLGNIYKGRRDLDAAMAEFRKAIELRPDYARAYLRVAEVHLERGAFENALAALRNADEFGAADAAPWVGRLERAIELNEKLPLLLRGEIEEKDAQVYGVLGTAEANLHRHVTAARLYALAFERDPTIVGSLRENAVLQALHGGIGECHHGGEDYRRLPPEERRIWLDRALAWARVQLEGYRRAVDRDPASVRTSLPAWSASLDVLRGKESMEEFPEAVRGAWVAFLGELEALVARAREAK